MLHVFPHSPLQYKLNEGLLLYPQFLAQSFIPSKSSTVNICWMNECLHFLFIFSILRFLIAVVLAGLPSFWSACACQMNFPKALLNLVWCLVCRYSVTFEWVSNSHIFWRVFPCSSSAQEAPKAAILAFTIKIVTPWRTNSLSFNWKRQSNVVIRVKTLYSNYLNPNPSLWL